MTPGEVLLTVSEVAHRLKLSPRSIYRWIERDEFPIPVVRIGDRGVIRITERALERWIEKSSALRGLTSKQAAVSLLMAEQRESARRRGSGKRRSPRKS